VVITIPRAVSQLTQQAHAARRAITNIRIATQNLSELREEISGAA